MTAIKKSTISKINLVLTLLLVFMAVGCGGGGGGSGTEPSTTASTATVTLTGTVATGKGFAGKVKVLDSAGNEKETTIANDSTYSITVLAANNPYFLKAYNTDSNGNEKESLFSVLDAAESSGGTVVNITPLTSVVAANVLQEDPGIAFEKTRFQTFASTNKESMKTKMSKAVTDVKTKLGTVMSGMNFSNQDIEKFNPIKNAFQVNDKSMDLLLDVVKVEKKSSDGSYNISVGEFVYVDKWQGTDIVQDKKGSPVQSDASGAIPSASLTANYPEEVFEILQKKNHTLTTPQDRETAVSEVLDKIVAKIKESKDISVVYGTGSIADASSECSGSVKPYLCAIHIDNNMDGVPDDMSRMIEVSFPEDERFYKAGLEYGLAMPWQIAAFTQGGSMYVTIGVPHATVRTYFKPLKTSDPQTYNALMMISSRYKQRMEDVVAATFASGRDGFTKVNLPWADQNGTVFKITDSSIAAFEKTFGGTFTNAIANTPTITPNVMMYEWTKSGTTVEAVTSALRNAFLANTVADMDQNGKAGEDADKAILPAQVKGFITANNPTIEQLGGMLNSAATNIWKNGYTLQQWKVVRVMDFSNTAQGRELKMIELCQDFYAGMALGFGAQHQSVLPCSISVWKGTDGKVHVGLLNTQFLFGVFFSDVQLGSDPMSMRMGQLFQQFPTMVFNELRGVVEKSLSSLSVTPNTSSTEFEIARAGVASWLATSPSYTMTSAVVKTDIVDKWTTAQENNQILDVRSSAHYAKGHVANATNIPYKELFSNLSKLDARKKIITQCYTGHTGQLTSTILNLTGYSSTNMRFGMMDWNLTQFQSNQGTTAQWDGVADYPTETTINTPTETFALPALATAKTTSTDILKSRAETYLTTTLSISSPTINSSDVKAIVDDWNNKKSTYQILSVRSAAHYANGHVPNAINIALADLASLDNLKKLDPNKTIIVYCYTGHTGQVATTILNLLGYKAINMKFGMMDWNLERAKADGVTPWDQAADYPVVQ